MKRVYGLVAISIFFISCTQAQPPAPAASAPAAKPYGTLAQVMRGIPFPNSNIIFDTQSTDPAAAQKPRGRAECLGTDFQACTVDGKRLRTPQSRCRRPATFC